jgi:flavin-dependent dehydrogenase
LIKQSLSDVTISFRQSDACLKSYPEPLVHTVLRTEFDHFLVERARAAGACVFEGTKALACERNGGVVITTSQGRFRAKIVVGADGANSVTRQLLNSRDRYTWQAGLYAEVPAGIHAAQSMLIDWGQLPGGYAWIFPKRECANVGAGCPTRHARGLRSYVSQCIAKPPFRGVVDPTAHTGLMGHQLPTFTKSTRFAGPDVVLVGDAAGLVEPLTGDGISYALHSAELASRVILANRDSASPQLGDYERLLRAELAREFAWARRLQRITARFPKLMHELVARCDDVWIAFGKALRGEGSFAGLANVIARRAASVWISQFVGAPR